VPAERRIEARVHVVLHTHWDREWYLPFAVYRRRLVALIDTLLLALGREPALRFHLDGQMALVDDYLELRPEREAALRRAAADGRISLGPWYTLPDEHLVSGEALIRNLELGLARAGRLGRPMRVGYLPDQFGHTAQMPQVLRRLGIETAVLWRGVPAAIGSAVFSWEALDGSAVDAVHLARGYGHAVALPVEAAALQARLAELVDEQREGNPGGPWLLVSGDDHTPVPLGVATALRALDGPLPAAVSSLEDFIAARPPAGDRWRGELHSGASSNVLKGTLSARFPLKLRHAALERRLERYLEPALALSDARWPERELAYCWRQVILNSAHDSICGCSIDQVHEQASERLARAEALAGALWDRLGAGTGRFNPSLFAREGVPPLGVAETEPAAETDAEPPDLWLEDCADAGDEYTFDPPPGAEPVRRPLTGARFRRREGEPFTRVKIALDNRAPDHRVRLLVPADTSGGAWAGVAFGAVHRPFRRPGTEPGLEYDLPTDPARLFVSTEDVAVLVAGPFEYELLENAIAVTLLRCVPWLSRNALRNRPVAAGPQVATPAAQMPGRHAFEIGVHRHGGWADARVPRWAEVFAHPLVPAPGVALRPVPEEPDPAVVLSALRRLDGRRQLRTYRCAEPWRIEERWLD
jgi:Glycosyl hydrolases family 38 N-terminal domain/Alpha mannosidase middle domain